MMPILGALILQAATAQWTFWWCRKIQFHLQVFHSFYRKPGAQPGDFRGDSVAMGITVLIARYLGEERSRRGLEPLSADPPLHVHDHLCRFFLG